MRDLSGFNGWLKVCFISSLYLMILSLGGIALSIWSMGAYPDWMGLSVLIVLDLALGLYFLWRILATLKTPSEESPNKVVMLFLWMMGVSVVFIFMSWIFWKLSWSPLEIKTRHVMQWLGRTMLPFLVWSAYFKKSVRVKIHYKKNADLNFL